MILKCIIVDDEAPAQRILERYIRRLPFFATRGQMLFRF
jgi:response regulator of citrate/malate metabolism